MKIDELISWETQSSLIRDLTNELDQQLKLYVKLELQDEDCDKVILYFKKTRIREDILSKARGVATLLQIAEYDELVKRLSILVNVGDLITELDKLYSDRVEEEGLESIIPYFSL